MKKLTWNLEEIERMKKYDVSGHVSNTALSKFNIEEGGSPKLFKLFIEGYREEIKSPAMEIGSLIHSYFEKPERIHKMEFVKPSDSIKKWADDFIANTENVDLSDEERKQAIIASKINTNVFASTKKEETILKKFQEAEPYILFLKNKKENEGKIIVSTKEYTHLTDAITAVNENDLARKLLNEGNKEVKFVFERFGIKIKAIIDNLQINDDDKKIYVTDLKVTFCGAYEILNYFSERNYDRQLSLYREAVIQLIKDGTLPNYPIECYIVNVSLKSKKATVVKASESILSEGKSKHDDLLKQIKEHMETDDWNSTIEEQKKGFIELWKLSK